MDAVLGLAADALGMAELGLTERLLADIERSAREHAGHAVRASRAAAALRHEIKSELVAVVARSCAGEPVEWVHHTLEGLAHRTSVARLGSLEWPVRLLLVRTPGAPDPSCTVLHQARLTELLAGIHPLGWSLGATSSSGWPIAHSGLRPGA